MRCDIRQNSYIQLCDIHLSAITSCYKRYIQLCDSIIQSCDSNKQLCNSNMELCNSNMQLCDSNTEDSNMQLCGLKLDFNMQT